MASWFCTEVRRDRENAVERIKLSVIHNVYSSMNRGVHFSQSFLTMMLILISTVPVRFHVPMQDDFVLLARWWDGDRPRKSDERRKLAGHALASV